MSLLVLGLSHHAVPLDLLEAVALGTSESTELETTVFSSEYVRESVVLSTCNRTEVYAEVTAFHGAVIDIARALAERTGRSTAELQEHLYVHFEDRCVAHAFRLGAGLDSMAVGEAQILGQIRSALTRAQRDDHVGPILNALLQDTLRVGKRVHSETAIDDVSGSLVTAGLVRAQQVLGPLESAKVLVIGAGGMGALAATTVQRHGIHDLTIVNRGAARADRLADRLGARTRPFTDGATALADADLVVSSTGARGQIITHSDVLAAQEQRGGRPQVYLDLAMPHDISRAVSDIPHVVRVGLEDLAADLSATGELPEVKAADDVVTAEVAAHVAGRAAGTVVPTITALRSRAEQVVADELVRLDRRLPHLDAATRAELEATVRRTVHKLLHTPTVRVKQLAETENGARYAHALHELFDLDPRDIAVVSTPTVLPELDALLSLDEEGRR